MKKIKQLTYGAIFTALLITIQYLSKPLGQYVTGSLVNAILFISCFYLKQPVSFFIALISPIFAFLLGIGTPIFPLVLIIGLGNCLFVFLIHFSKNKKCFEKAIIIFLSAFLKYLFLNTFITKIILPLLNINNNQKIAISLSFSYPQLITALAGSLLATVILKIINKK